MSWSIRCWYCDRLLPSRPLSHWWLTRWSPSASWPCLSSEWSSPWSCSLGSSTRCPLLHAQSSCLPQQLSLHCPKCLTRQRPHANVNQSRPAAKEMTGEAASLEKLPQAHLLANSCSSGWCCSMNQKIQGLRNEVSEELPQQEQHCLLIMVVRLGNDFE